MDFADEVLKFVIFNTNEICIWKESVKSGKSFNLGFTFAAKFFMRRLLFLLLIIGASVAVWFFVFKKDTKWDKGPKQAPIAQSKYSTAFNQSVDDALNSYYLLSENFVNWDSSKVKANALTLRSKLEAVKWDELNKDSSGIGASAKGSVDNAKNDIATIEGSADLEAQRRGFQSLSNNLYDFLRVIQFDASKVYWQECPMAFNDDETAHWLSNKKQIRNPYLGLHHPKYHSGMLACGDTKDSLNYGQK